MGGTKLAMAQFVSKDDGEQHGGRGVCDLGWIVGGMGSPPRLDSMRPKPRSLFQEVRLPWKRILQARGTGFPWSLQWEHVRRIDVAGIVLRVQAGAGQAQHKELTWLVF